jgi:predicted O-methyltransferase YrrM
MKFEAVDALLQKTPFMTSRQGRILYDFILEHRLGRIIELGFAHGKSSCYFAAVADELGGDAHVTTMDRTTAVNREPNIDQLLERCGLTSRVTPVFSHTSFTWDLMKMLERDPAPRFDFAYLDGGHSWDTTGYGFFLVDRLLVPGGWMVFDDLDWTFGGAKRTSQLPKVQRMLEEERTTPQVRKVFELLVQTHPGYTDLHEKDGWGWARKRPA